ncbi:MAG: prepilin-type N-terminal cleavage/methylation domain-containing protein [Armatimonadetes bacterium]|nr:prepilin-type N-terminal cleavage/methylation domain-containing protein [Armatimonadota bacterium]
MANQNCGTDHSFEPEAWAPPRRRGHTLAELMVVLALLVLVAALALPNHAPWRAAATLDAQEDTLLAALEYARGRAVAAGVRHWVEFDLAAGRYALLAFRPEEAVATETSESNEPPVEEWHLPEGVEIESAAVAPLAAGILDPLSLLGLTPLEEEATLTFYPEGNADAALVVLHGADGTRRAVAVDPLTGQARRLATEELPSAGASD